VTLAPGRLRLLTRRVVTSTRPATWHRLSSGSSFWDHAVNRQGEKMKRLCEFNTAMPRFPFAGNIIAFREVGDLHHRYERRVAREIGEAARSACPRSAPYGERRIQNFIYFVALVTARTGPTCRT
jgi:hypothetical protein